MSKIPTAVVAMSGGVDSSVAAGLLQREGYAVIGATLRLRPCGESADVRWCCSAGAEEQARAVCGRLDVPHYVVEASEAFEEAVLKPAWQEYDSGRTPSPCILCNEKIKLAMLLNLARRVDAEKVATGHYARITTDEERGVPVLRRGLDPDKDQSYFLFSLSPAQLEATLFPLGALRKREVRALAREMGFANADRKESQDACFVLQEAGFVEALRLKFGAEAKPGAIVDKEGRALGAHAGIHRYTVGQRKGLGIALGKRAYVTRIDAETREVVLGDDPEALASANLIASQVVWTGGTIPRFPLRCEAQIRYRHKPVRAVVERVSDDRMAVVFDEPQHAIAPGQAVVWYDEDRVLGGGWIASHSA